MHLVRPAVDPAVPAEVREVAAASLAKIVGKVPDRHEAEQYLHQEIQRLLAGRLPYRARRRRPGRNVGLGRHEPPDDQPQAAASTTRRSVPGDAPDRRSRGCAAEASSSEARRLQLLTSLELAKVLGGLDRPLDIAPLASICCAAFRPTTMNQVLTDAIKRAASPPSSPPRSAGQIGDANVLTSAGPQESPLAQALLHLRSPRSTGRRPARS